jgi:esterase/lipase superfamily enzyme/Flp pilus assembly protein TadD
LLFVLLVATHSAASTGVARAAETQAAETQPAHAKAPQTKAGEKTGNKKPTDTKAAETKPADTKPAPLAADPSGAEVRKKLDAGDAAGALPLAESALKDGEKQYPANDSRLVQLQGDLARAYMLLGRYGDAETLLKRAIKDADKADPGGTLVAAPLSGLARLYCRLLRYEEAAPLIKRALDIRQKKLPAGHADIATSLTDLAALRQSAGQLDEAAKLYRQALDIRQKALPVDHPDLAIALDNLAAIYRLLGRYADAEPLLKEALERRRLKLGMGHMEVARSLNSLGVVYELEGRNKEAEQMLAAAVETAERAGAQGGAEAATLRQNLGIVLKAEGRLAEAAPLLQRAAADTEAAFGVKHPQTAVAQMQLAELELLQGNAAAAEALFAKAKTLKPAGLREIPIYFATDRKPDAAQKRVAFGNERGAVTLGSASVIVPPPKPPGIAGEPRNVGELRQLPLSSLAVLNSDALVRAARARLSQSSSGEALVFVHGFNVSFDNALRRAAQLAYDLDFDGPVFLFSWPTGESVWGYVRDRDIAQASQENVAEFLKSVVAPVRARNINLITHSVGSLAINEALRSMDAGSLERLKLDQIVLASPHVDGDLFESCYTKLRKTGTRSTIYSKAGDWALWVSAKLHSPLGYLSKSGPEKLVDGTDMIDTASVNADVFSLNRDLYADSPALIADLRQIIAKYRAPDERNKELVKIATPAGAFWRYRDNE